MQPLACEVWANARYILSQKDIIWGGENWGVVVSTFQDTGKIRKLLDVSLLQVCCWLLRSNLLIIRNKVKNESRAEISHELQQVRFAERSSREWI